MQSEAEPGVPRSGEARKSIIGRTLARKVGLDAKGPKMMQVRSCAPGISSTALTSRGASESFDAA